MTAVIYRVICPSVQWTFIILCQETGYPYSIYIAIDITIILLLLYEVEVKC